MTQGEFEKKVAERLDMSVRQTKALLDEVFAVLGETIDEVDRLSIHGFGTFKAVNHAARKGRNPRTGEEISIEPKRVVVFKRSPQR